MTSTPFTNLPLFARQVFAPLRWAAMAIHGDLQKTDATGLVFQRLGRHNLDAKAAEANIGALTGGQQAN